MIVAIIQARMGSLRLPGKVLKKVLGKTLLEHLILRVKRARGLDKIIVATTTSKKDAPIATLATRCGVGCFRGSENDVLDRYYQSAKRSEDTSELQSHVNLVCRLLLEKKKST